jgi:hypothetical protein
MEQPLVEAYVDTAQELAAWPEDNSPVEFGTLGVTRLRGQLPATGCTLFGPVLS